LNVSTQTSETPRTAANRGGKYLTFVLGNEEYGLAILKVREIIGFMDITAVPRTPDYVRGVINLRGQVISVIDLRAKFGMAMAERTEHTCIIVVEMIQEGRKLSTGIIVDRVSEVLNIAAENVEDAPAFGCGVKTDFIVGMGKIGSSVKILLDIDRVLTNEELAGLQAAQQMQAAA
jgi:purine-binding chemotaxis protein CheW